MCPTRIGALIKDSRVRKGLSVERVAEEMEIAKTTVLAIERGARLPGLALLVRFLDKLSDSDDQQARRDELARWLVTWLGDEASSSTAKGIRGLRTDQQDDLSAAVERLSSQVFRATRRPGQRARSLEYLADFGPFIAIGGDRREPEPKSLADLFIFGFSITDVGALIRASQGLIRNLRSDKLVLELDNQALRGEFGNTNLLVIGGPDVNWAARVINPSSLWRFRVDPAWEQWDRMLRSHTELTKGGNYRATFAAFGTEVARLTSMVRPAHAARQGRQLEIAKLAAEVLRGPFTEGDRMYAPRQIANVFREGGFTDPTESTVFGEFLDPNADIDLATISVAPNPFDPDDRYVAVMVGGIGGPGTAQALRVLLERPEEFREHPFGGIIEVQLPFPENYASRFDEPTWRWLSPGYTPEGLAQSLARDPDRKAAYSLVQRLSGDR